MSFTEEKKNTKNDYKFLSSLGRALFKNMVSPQQSIGKRSKCIALFREVKSHFCISYSEPLQFFRGKD